MSDPDPPREGTGDPIEFGEWLDMAAESRGVPQEEVLNQLISSYWTLNEMSEMIKEPEGDEVEQDVFSWRVSGTHTPLTRSEFDAFREEIDERFADVAQRLAAVEAAREDEVVTAAEVQQRVEQEFETLHRILKYLIDATEANEESLAELEERIESAVTEVPRERARLDHLKQQAMDLGAESADCAYCGKTVNLSLLTVPTCPRCGRDFEGISPRREFFGIGLGSHVLKTGSISRDAPDESRSGGRGEGRDRSIVGGFEWVGGN